MLKLHFDATYVLFMTSFSASFSAVAFSSRLLFVEKLVQFKESSLSCGKVAELLRHDEEFYTVEISVCCSYLTV